MAAVIEDGRTARRIRTSVRAALGIVAFTTAALAGVQWAWIAQLDAPYGWLLESYGLVGLVTVLAGLWLWVQRPANRTGMLLVVVGLLELAASYGNTPDRWTVLVGELCAEGGIAALAHLVLAFPSGGLRSRLDRRLVIAHYVASIGLQVPMYVFRPGDPAYYFTALQASGHESWVKHLDDLQGLVSGSIMVIAAVVVWRRWIATPLRSQRFALAVVYAYGIAVLVSFPLTARVLRPRLDWSVYTLFGVQLTLMLGVPIVYLTAMLSGGLARTVEVAELARWMSLSDDQRPPLAQALARAVGDPTLRVLYRVHDDVDAERFVDADGGPAAVPDDDEHGVSVVRGPDGDSAVIVYDRRLVGEPELVDAAGSVAAIALDRERLHVELLASRAELVRSRQRIVEQGERERRQLARDLHDGVQGRLVAAALHAGTLAAGGSGRASEQTAARVRDEIDAAITELRHLVQGVMPALLVERGLFAAADDLVDRVPVPAHLHVEGTDDLPAHVASAGYFVISEALSNVAKHARAEHVDVRLSVADDVLRISVSDDGVGGATSFESSTNGSGLRGMADRVAALEGRFHLRSEAGRGTTVEVELPCGS